ncbi:DinB family protein [uncultured Nitratireductor sp.]|uniref:DinB family protein n=1 Tax=Nitratireductor aquimarinus TaxID=889300 RepID=UPI002617890B|nr:DinB family protein [uncultured Nitratireductor sp.]
MSGIKDAIRRQIDTSGTLLLRVSKTLSDDGFFEEPANGGSMAWTLTHLFTLQDWARNRVFGGVEPRVDRASREAFKGGRAVYDEDRDRLGTRREIENAFANEQYRTIAALNAFDVAKWDQPTPSGCRFPAYGALWEHLAAHNYWHLGALSVSHPHILHLTLVAPRFYSVDPEEMAAEGV